MSWSNENIEQLISDLERIKTQENRNQKIQSLVDNIPLDQSKIDEIKKDIDGLYVDGYDHLTTGRKVEEIKKIIEKYRLKE